MLLTLLICACDFCLSGERALFRFVRRSDEVKHKPMCQYRRDCEVRMLMILYLNNGVLLSKALSCDRLPEEI